MKDAQKSGSIKMLGLLDRLALLHSAGDGKALVSKLAAGSDGVVLERSVRSRGLGSDDCLLRSHKPTNVAIICAYFASICSGPNASRDSSSTVIEISLSHATPSGAQFS